MKRLINIVVSGWLAILLLFGTTAKEYIHLFADHTDTVHTELHHDHIVIEPEHHHCTFLSFVLSDFIQDTTSFYLTYHSTVYGEHIVPEYEAVRTRTVSLPALRGPPALHA